MNRLQSRRPLLTKYLVFVGMVACFVAPSIVTDAAVRTVALTSRQAPGTLDGVAFGSFSVPVLNDAGRTAFHASLTGNGVGTTNSTGIWSEGFGSLKLVARRGSHAPGLPDGVNYGALDPPLLNNAGHTAFWAGTVGGGQGVWSERTGSVGLVAHTSSQLPDLPSGYTVGSFDVHALNNASQTAIWSFLNPNDSGIWSEGSGNLTRVALSRTQAAGLPNGVNFGLPSFPVLNDQGHIAFAVSNQGVWSESSGSLELVARAGSQAPGAPPGLNYWTFDAPLINNIDQTVFHARLISSDGAPSGAGIWSATPGNPALVVRTTTQAPGLPTGMNFFGFNSPVLNNSGQIAFQASFTEAPATSNRGIWLSGSEGVALIARSGDQAPGTPLGTIFRDNSTSAFIGYLALNDAGQIAFGAALSGVGTNSSNSHGIWAADRAGILRLIVRTGDLLEIVPGEFRTISSLSAGELNNVGQLAFRATFTDGSQGIFVSNAVAVPEPGAILVATFAFLLGVASRRPAATR